jgi:signal transduction histidine kinase
VGVLSLRKDRILVRSEAQEQAQRLASSLLPKIWETLSSDPRLAQVSTNTASHLRLETLLFRVDKAGRLVFPVPYEEVPTPVPFEISQLSPEQRRLWAQATSLEAGGGDAALITQGYEEFMRSRPPKPFLAAANFATGLILAKGGKTEEACEFFRKLITDFPEARSEAGLPLKPMAELKLLQCVARSGNRTEVLAAVDSFCSNAVYEPSILTGPLLEAGRKEVASEEEAGAFESWQETWDRLVRAQPVLSAAAARLANLSMPRSDFSRLLGPGEPAPKTPLAFWFDLPEGTRSQSLEPWVAIQCAESRDGAWYACRPEGEVGLAITRIMEGQLPEYLGPSVELAGRRITNAAPDLRLWSLYDYSSKGAGQRKKEFEQRLATTILASVSQFQAGADELKLSIFLTSPSTLYRLQRTRTFWFGSLIAVSALAAAVGLWGGYRAFRRQLRLNELKSNFVSSVSHELRAPIASVRLMAENLERGKVTEAERQRDYYRLITQECRRLSSLVENVLDFSRIEQGRKLYEFEPTDMTRLVETTRELMEPYAAERGIELKLAQPLPPAGTEAVVDGKGIQQAMVNLIDNALKHSDKGKFVAVGVAVMAAGARRAVGLAGVDRGPDTVIPGNGHCELTPEKERLAIWVEDVGEGIPPEEHRLIFERFYRRGSELRRKTQGVGIGLSIVKHIVEAHHGLIRIESQPGKGSRFTIELPMRRDVRAGFDEQFEPEQERTSS